MSEAAHRETAMRPACLVTKGTPIRMNNVVSLSGGKDSTAMLHLMLERGESIAFDWQSHRGVR